MKIYAQSGAHLWLLMWKASHAVSRYDKASVAESGFGVFTDFVVLEVLLHKNALPVNTIGEKVHLTSGSITTAVQRLEKRGFVTRRKSTEDARVVLVELTEAGRRTIEIGFALHSKNLEALFDVFTAEEAAQFAELMKRLGAKAEAGLRE